MEDKQTVLIIEDEVNIRDLIETILSKNGFVTIGVDSAEAGIKKIASLKPSLIMLDIQLPHMDGLEACRKFRQDPLTKHIPIILVSIQSSDIDKIIGLESGADDFIAKPFHHGELLARVKAVLRRTRETQSKAQAQTQIKDEVFSLDMESRSALLNKKKLDLTHKEFELLALFVKNHGKVLTRDVISTQIWERENLETSRTIDVHVGRLRKKLGKQATLIQTMGKVGYAYKRESSKN